MTDPTILGARIRRALKGFKNSLDQELDSQEPFFKFLDPYVELWI